MCVPLGVLFVMWEIGGLDFFSMLKRPFKFLLSDQQSEQLGDSEVKSKAKTLGLGFVAHLVAVLVTLDRTLYDDDTGC